MKYFINEFPETLNEPWCSFSYEWRVEYKIFHSEEVRNWLDNNMEWKEMKAISINEDNSFLFSCEEDAMAFKLRWQ